MFVFDTVNSPEAIFVKAFKSVCIRWENMMPSVYLTQAHVALRKIVIMDIITDLTSKHLFVSTNTNTEVCTHSHRRGGAS